VISLVRFSWRLPLAAASLLALGACSPTDNPRLAMCQAMGNNLVGEISSWDNTDVSERADAMIIDAFYTPASGQPGIISCVFERDKMNRDDEDANFKTAPTVVTLNGRRLGTREILQAGSAASAEQLRKLAAETKKQSAEAARDVTQKAEEITGQAEVFANQAERKAGELVNAAKEAARGTAEKVKQALDNR